MDAWDLLTNPFGVDALDWSDHVGWALVPLRLVLGYIVFDAGRGKWARGISGTGEWFRGLGFPAPQLLARWVAGVEVVGGTLLIVGLFTPLAALFIASNMAVATWTQITRLHAPFQGGDVQGWELDLLMLVAAVTLLLAAPTPFSLDRLLFVD